ncbi:MAG: hypothetical protein AAGA69_00030 [Pseudomonadota bacterium]
MLFYLLFCAIVIGGGYGLHHYWAGRIKADLQYGAKEDFARIQRTDAPLLEGLDEGQFEQIYTETHFPRFPAYVLATVGIFLLGSPIILGLLAGLAYYAAEWGWIPQPGDVATDLYLGAGDASIIRRTDTETLSYIVEGFSGFYYFFGLLFFWMAVVWFVMRRYHKRAPGDLREEVLRRR